MRWLGHQAHLQRFPHPPELCPGCSSPVFGFKGENKQGEGLMASGFTDSVLGD